MIRILFVIIVVLFILECNKTAERDSKNSAHTLLFPQPDTNTFFPLIAQSAWHYEQFMEGTLEPGNSQIDSVIEVIETDTGFNCKMVRMTGQGHENFRYFINTDGIVSIIDSASGVMSYCALFPKSGEQIGEMRYSQFLNDKKTIIRLETSDYENATEEQQMEWQANIFEKGVGQVSFGGSSLSMMLTEFHIGNGPVRKK